MILFIFHFFAWTLLLYWIHRVGHSVPFIQKFHREHHKFISANVKVNQPPNDWHWSNLFLFNDNWNSTIDLWLTEVIPTIVYSWMTGQWWISVFYYIWAAFIQERIEHNPKFDIYPFLTSGQSHLVHHNNPEKNYGLFFPIWDKMFGTFKNHKLN
jgi:sterol desaturase/sphingolipid hydroxylase (fatty acid hydroxylase superfamily)